MSTFAQHALQRVRYAAAAPVIAAGGPWVDLGCGDGRAAAEALDGLAGEAVLVDGSPEAVAQAERALAAFEVTPVVADLGTPEGVASVREAIADRRNGTVTCFGTVEGLTSYVPVVDLLAEMAERRAMTVLLGLSLSGPESHGAFEEMRRLLPAEVHVARQLELTGSALVAPDAPVGEVGAPAAFTAPSGLVAAFGPEARTPVADPVLLPVDGDVDRSREQRLEAEVALLRARLAEVDPDWHDGLASR